MAVVSRFIRDHAEVQDVAQETFIKAYRALPNFRGESAFYTWLYRISINTAKTFSSLVAAAPAMDIDAEEAEFLTDSENMRDIENPKII